MKIDQVLEEYRQGDADKRMSLFLYYRDLREEFTRIERDDPADLSATDRISGHVEQGMVRKFLVRLRPRSCPLRPRASGDQAVS